MPRQRQRQRQRQFDHDEVLDKSNGRFWRNGFDGASMNELKEAMGMSAPSIYSAFENKMGLFDAVLGRYRERRLRYHRSMLAEPTAFAAAARMLREAAEWLTDTSEPPGCFLVQAGLAASSEGGRIPYLLAAQRNRVQSLLGEWFQAGQDAGEIPETVDVAALARYIDTTFLGMCVQAASGAKKAELVDIAESALRGWPR